MGRIRLNALRVRPRALAALESKQTTKLPAWLNVVSDIPPSTQVLVRPQPQPQPLIQIRTKTIPSPRDLSTLIPTEITTSTPPRRQQISTSTNRKARTRKASKLFQPLPITYEEDTLRQTFYTEHPWELARPRMVLETTTPNPDNTTPISSASPSQSSNVLSAEHAISRQLHLLQTVPNITLAESYDIARKEFYTLRRREQLSDTIAAEESRYMGASFGSSAIEISTVLENKKHEDWEQWSREEVLRMMASVAAFEGGTSNVASVAESMGQRPEFGGPGGDGAAGVMEKDMQQYQGALAEGGPSASGAARDSMGANRLGPGSTTGLPTSRGAMGSRVFRNEARRASAPGAKSVI